MKPITSSPPLAPLREIVTTLESAGIVCALGGSGLLASLGLETVIHDWDLTMDAPLENVRKTLERHAPEHTGPNGVHADNKLVISSHATECIVRFAFRVERGVAHIPTEVASEWNGVPVSRAEAWAVAYALLGRAEKSQRLFAHLRTHGAKAEFVGRLREEPLPPELLDALAGLPLRSSSDT
jgi:hypothetical protein